MSASAQDSDQTGPSFVVGGEVFECVAFVPHWNLMRLAAAMDSGDDMKAMAAMYRFILFMVKPHEHERLEAYLESIDLERSDLDHAIGDALVEMAGRGKLDGVPKATRPSEESSGHSSGGSTGTPPSRRVVSLSRGTVSEEPADSTEPGSSTG